MSKKKTDRTTKHTHSLMERVLRLIMGGDVKNNEEIGQILGYQKHSIARYTNNLVAIGKIHITRYGKSYGSGKPPEQAEYAFGPAPEGFVPANSPNRRTVCQPRPVCNTVNVLSLNGKPVVIKVPARNTGEFKRCEFETFFFGGTK